MAEDISGEYLEPLVAFIMVEEDRRVSVEIERWLEVCVVKARTKRRKDKIRQAKVARRKNRS